MNTFTNVVRQRPLYKNEGTLTPVLNNLASLVSPAVPDVVNVRYDQIHTIHELGSSVSPAVPDVVNVKVICDIFYTRIWDKSLGLL